MGWEQHNANLLEHTKKVGGVFSIRIYESTKWDLLCICLMQHHKRETAKARTFVKIYLYGRKMDVVF